VLEQNEEQHVRQTVLGSPADNDQILQLRYKFAVEQIRPDRSALIQATIEALRIEQQGPAGHLVFDSSDAGRVPPAQFAAYAAFVGAQFKLVLRPDGRVPEVFGDEELIAAVFDKLALPPEISRADAEASLRGQFGGRVLRENLNMLLAVYPDGPVRPGGSWRAALSQDCGLPLNLQSTWTLKQRVAGRALIDHSGVITPNLKPVPLQMSGRSLSYELSGTQSGTLELSEADGQIYSGRISRQLGGTVSIDSPDSGPAPAWPISIASELSYSLTRE